MKHKKKNLKGYELFKYAKKIIPGGSQLFGKRAELYAPGLWPSYYKKAKGCEVTDLNNKKYLDFTMVGTGTSVLGYANKTVNKSIQKSIDNGSISTLNNKEEVDLAELLVDLHPKMEMVRYARSGGEILSIAIRIARAYTGRDKVAICGYHGWHDWYISANLKNPNNLNNHLLAGIGSSGVPSLMKGLTTPFEFNEIESLEKILKKDPKRYAAVIIEPFRDNGPKKGYLEAVKSVAKKYGAVLIFDEITSGFRETLGGMYKNTKVIPDMVTFGKAISNGIPMSAVLGRRKIMKSFTSTFVSSTYWGDRTGPAAAIATINFMKKNNVGKQVKKKGLDLKKIIYEAALKSKLDITISGMPSLLSYRLNVPNWPLALTYIIISMLKKGILSNDRIYSNFSHSPKHIRKFKLAINQTFKELSKKIKDKNLKDSVPLGVKKMGFDKVLK
ncbi:aminotransferase class III-fold pyridoxal phosphate-dependent enzyme [Candidatus Pelagibacter sp. HIMB1521]|uniref:aminotransferase class III-fold pyridoxal phosphate-dependent enzyme n=1 Tax=Candidatus Pelagibacter sp. HIMB1521 TaxID=3413344 RepID=UPI003F8346B7